MIDAKLRNSLISKYIPHFYRKKKVEPFSRKEKNLLKTTRYETDIIVCLANSLELRRIPSVKKTYIIIII